MPFSLPTSFSSCLVRSLLGLTLVAGLLAAKGQCQLVEAAKGVSTDGPFPNDWYVRDGEGLEDLRALEGKPAKELSISEWRGEATTLEKLKGKIVVLDFWATWCGPCMAAIPKNVEFVEKYKDKGVVLIGVHDSKAGWDSVDQVISEKGINYTVGLDNSGESTKGYALKFWPTYFIIDREGIVRGAAIKPNKIEEAVNQIMGNATAPSSAPSLKLASFPTTWFLGGEKRQKGARTLEGKSASKLIAAKWLNGPVENENWDRQVRVVQFVRPELSTSVAQLSKLQKVADRFSNQGVTFVAVCDARAPADRMQQVMEENRIEIPVAIDAAAEKDPLGMGATSNSMGIKFAPATIVIDRSGKLRATGLKADFLDQVLNQLLAEPMPLQPELEEVVESAQEKQKQDVPTKEDKQPSAPANKGLESSTKEEKSESAPSPDEKKTPNESPKADSTADPS